MYSDFEEPRGNRGFGNNRYRGGRNYGRGRDYYDQENYHPPAQGTRGRGRGNYGYDNQHSNGDSWGSNSRGGGYRGRSSGYWGRSNRGGGRAPRGRGRGFYAQEPEDVQYCRTLKGHTQGVTALLVDPSSGQLFSASKDGTIKVWDYQKGECTSTVEVGGEVDSMLMESGFLIVGLHARSADLRNSRGGINVYKLQDGSMNTLDGHLGPVYSLAAANNMLFSGGHDASIRVWQFNQGSGMFEASAALTAAQGGHHGGVKCLQVINVFLFSADFLGTIKVWDLSSGQCAQTIESAHSEVIMSLLSWEGYLLSASVDGSIRIWQSCETIAPGAVLDPQPTYSHPPDGLAEFGPCLVLGGSSDPRGNSVLLSWYDSKEEGNSVRLWQLPDFSDRGRLPGIVSRALQCYQDHMFAGDYKTGIIKVYRWRASA